MRLIIAGGRSYRLTSDDYVRIEGLLSEVSEVVSGGATGADSDGEAWAREHDLPVRQFLPKWRKFGRTAGLIRSREMAEYADGVALFTGGRVTDNMFAEAIRSGIRVYDLIS